MLFLHLPIEKDVKLAITKVKKVTDSLKGSLLPFSFVTAMKILASLPFALPVQVLNYLSTKGTIVFSNVNATKTPWVYCGHM